jgi:hypothetical protein
MRSPRTLIPAVIALIVVVALAVAGLSNMFARSFTLQVPNISTAGQLEHSKRLCEGPISATGGAFRQAQVFGAATSPIARAEVRVSEAGSGRVLGAGTFQATPTPGIFTVTFPRPISDASPVRVCVISRSGAFAIQGSTAYHRSVKMGRTASNFSLSLGNEKSPLAALGTVFSRAAVLKLSWVGAWTFWLLAAALLGCFGLGVIAVARAAADDVDSAGD